MIHDYGEEKMSGWESRLGLAPVAAAVAAATAGGLLPQEVYAQKPGANMSTVIADAGYGLRFAPTVETDVKDFIPFDASVLKGKPYILVQGYNGCQFCSKISQNLAKIRKELDRNGAADVPIVVINVKPSEDAPDIKDYVQNYIDVGACANAEDYGRNFFILFPKDRAAAVKLQQDIEASFNREDEDSHGMKISVVNGTGICTSAALGTSEGERSTRLVNAIVEAVGQARGR